MARTNPEPGITFTTKRPSTSLTWRDATYSKKLFLIGICFALMAIPASLLDLPVRDFIKTLPIGGDINQEIRAFGQFGQGGFLIVILASVVVFYERGQRRFSQLVRPWILAGIACHIIKGQLLRIRPKHKVGSDFIWNADIPEISQFALDSFPSAHTAGAVVTSAWLIFMFPRLKNLWISLALIVGLSRVILNHHWISDVVAGAALGCLISSFFWRKQ
jgi:membrane-associated phospholipid phosphatase